VRNLTRLGEPLRDRRTSAVSAYARGITLSRAILRLRVMQVYGGLSGSRRGKSPNGSIISGMRGFGRSP